MMALFVLVFSCEWSFRNYDAELPPQRIAQVIGPGLRIYLIGAEREFFDRLLLEPGEYMIGFRQESTRLTGVANCRLERDTIYQIRITGRKFLKKSKTWMLVARCDPLSS